MELFAPITQMASAFREFVAPRYRPELYYMRGPGPASRAPHAQAAATTPESAVWRRHE